MRVIDLEADRVGSVSLLDRLPTSVPALRRMIFPAPVWHPDLLADELISVPREQPTYLIHRPAPAGAPTVVYLHGNGCDLASIGFVADLLTAEGYGYAAIEYPGYGAAADQRPSEDALHDAVAAGLDWLAAERGVTREETVLIGESLGSAVAARLAAEKRCAKLAMISAFTSMDAMFSSVVGAFPSPLIPDHFRTERLTDRIKQPTLFVHGSEDSLVPPMMSLDLAEKMWDSRRVVLPGRAHDTMWQPPEQIVSTLAAFIG